MRELNRAAPKLARAPSSGRIKRLDMVIEVPLSKINRDDRRFQFRVGMSTVDVENSIRQHGQQVPVTLWGREPHTIIDGFRRVHALARLSHTNVKAILRDDLDENGAYQLSFIENVHRRAWTTFEKALAIRTAIVERKLSVKQVAAELTLSERQIHRYLELADFDPRLTDALRTGVISMAQAAVLHRASVENLDAVLPQATGLSLGALKRRLQPRRGGRPRSYVTLAPCGFRMSSFHLDRSTSRQEKDRMLAALERAIEIVKESMQDA